MAKKAKSKAAQEMAQRRAASLTPERRKGIAVGAAKARWAKRGGSSEAEQRLRKPRVGGPTPPRRATPAPVIQPDPFERCATYCTKLHAHVR